MSKKYNEETQKRNDCNDTEFQWHLANIQSCISRMASNSFAMKQWCFGSIGAICAFLATAHLLQQYWWLVFVPWIAFFCQNYYYLLLENRFRNFYNEELNNYQSSKEGYAGGYAPTFSDLNNV